jgi:hypothetical protein
MQHIIVLFIIIGIFIFMVAAVLGISYGLGVFMNSRGRAAMGPAAADPCARFEADRDWYEELPLWQRQVVIAWWLANRYLSNVKGCR